MTKRLHLHFAGDGILAAHQTGRLAVCVARLLIYSPVVSSLWK